MFNACFRMNIPKVRRHILEEIRGAFSIPGQAGLPLVKHLPMAEKEENIFLRKLALVSSSISSSSSNSRQWSAKGRDWKEDAVIVSFSVLGEQKDLLIAQEWTCVLVLAKYMYY